MSKRRQYLYRVTEVSGPAIVPVQVGDTITDRDPPEPPDERHPTEHRTWLHVRPGGGEAQRVTAEYVGARYLKVWK